MKKNLLLLFFMILAFSAKLFAQLPNDALYMPKNSSCVAIMGEQGSWNKYWENTLKRENLNIGTMTTRSIMPMVALGLTDNLNVIVGVPYVQTQTSAGNLLGQKGLQDLSVWLKYKLVKNVKGLSVHAIGGTSAPMSNYVPDFLPLSIGLGSKNATARLLVNYQTKPGFYATASGSYIARSNIKVDRDAYFFNDKLLNTNEVVIPNAMDASARVGFLKSDWQADVFFEKFHCLSGDYIRRNDMPYPTNKMSMNMAGAYIKYQPKNIGFNARFSQVVSGQNVGQSQVYTIGLLYQINNILK